MKNIKLVMSVIVYLISVVLANLLVGYFGEYSVFIVAFVFIGLDITLRDNIHELFDKHIFLKMSLLIVAGSVISYCLNKDIENIAKASFIAFLISGGFDTFIYSIFKNKSKFVRVNSSNVIASIIDSFLFITIAFGYPPNWYIVVIQTIVKIFGGFVWFLIINKVKILINKD